MGNFGELHPGNSKRREEREKEREGHEPNLQIQWMFYIAPKRRRDLVLLLPLREEKEGEEPWGPWPSWAPLCCPSHSKPEHLRAVLDKMEELSLCLLILLPELHRL